MDRKEQTKAILKNISENFRELRKLQDADFVDRVVFMVVSRYCTLKGQRTIEAAGQETYKTHANIDLRFEDIYKEDEKV